MLFYLFAFYSSYNERKESNYVRYKKRKYEMNYKRHIKQYEACKRVLS